MPGQHTQAHMQDDSENERFAQHTHSGTFDHLIDPFDIFINPEQTVTIRVLADDCKNRTSWVR